MGIHHIFPLVSSHGQRTLHGAPALPPEWWGDDGATPLAAEDAKGTPAAGGKTVGKLWEAQRGSDFFSWFYMILPCSTIFIHILPLHFSLYVYSTHQLGCWKRLETGLKNPQDPGHGPEIWRRSAAPLGPQRWLKRWYRIHVSSMRFIAHAKSTCSCVIHIISLAGLPNPNNPMIWNMSFRLIVFPHTESGKSAWNTLFEHVSLLVAINFPTGGGQKLYRRGWCWIFFTQDCRHQLRSEWNWAPKIGELITLSQINIDPENSQSLLMMCHTWKVDRFPLNTCIFEGLCGVYTNSGMVEGL